MKKTNKLYLIAEMGVNFYDTAKQLNITPLEAAKLYIDKAAEAGIDCAKFQSYKAHQPTGTPRKRQLKPSTSYFKSLTALVNQNIKNCVIIHIVRVWISPQHLLTMLPLIIFMIW